MRFHGLEKNANNTTLRRIVFAPSMCDCADDRGQLTAEGIRRAVKRAPAFSSVFHGFVVQAATAPTQAVASMADIVLASTPCRRSILSALAPSQSKSSDPVSLDALARAAISAVDAIIGADTHTVGLFGDEILLQAVCAVMAPQYAVEIFGTDLSARAGFMLKNPRGTSPEEAELTFIG